MYEQTLWSLGMLATTTRYRQSFESAEVKYETESCKDKGLVYKTIFSCCSQCILKLFLLYTQVENIKKMFLGI